jgi:hypothetical protein
MYTEFLKENWKESDHLGYLHVNGRTILKWILEEQDVNMWTRVNWLSIGLSSGLFGSSNRQFIDQLSKYELFEEAIYTMELVFNVSHNFCRSVTFSSSSWGSVGLVNNNIPHSRQLCRCCGQRQAGLLVPVTEPVIRADIASSAFTIRDF